MRYDPPSPSSPQLPPSSTTNPPSSSLHPAHAHLTRHTPSPASRSRSRSRPPSSGSAPPPSSSAENGAGGVEPARTTRARRNNSICGTSPPPFFGVHHGNGRPHAIVILGSRMGSLSGMAHAGRPLSTSSNEGGAGNGWYMPGQSQSSYVSFFFIFVFREADERKQSLGILTPSENVLRGGLEISVRSRNKLDPQKSSVEASFCPLSRRYLASSG